jgi:hypothetical protein
MGAQRSPLQGGRRSYGPPNLAPEATVSDGRNWNKELLALLGCCYVMLGESITQLRGAYTAACQPGLTSNSH